jgi:hypothetical protein
MCAAINNPASCEVRAVIRFLLARNNNAAESHRQLCEVYGPNVMSDSKVRQWCRLFKEGRTNVHDEERSGRPSVINDDLVVKVFDHPPYSPDLAPSDYHLFMHLKQWLASQSFEDADRLKTGVTTWFKSLAADFYDTGTRKLVPP